MTHKHPDLSQAAWRMFMRTHTLLVKRVDEELAAAGVLSSEYHEVLRALREAPERRLRLCDLADEVQRTRSGVTRLADRLEKAGLLHREGCPTDRRGAFAVLTDRGLAEFQRSRTVYAKAVAVHFGNHLGAQEAKTLRKALGRVLDALRDP